MVVGHDSPWREISNPLFLPFFLSFLPVCVEGKGWDICYGTWCAQRSKDSLWEPVVSVHHVSAGNQTQIIRISDKHLAPWSCLPSPSPQFLCISSTQIGSSDSEGKDSIQVQLVEQ